MQSDALISVEGASRNTVAHHRAVGVLDCVQLAEQFCDCAHLACRFFYTNPDPLAMLLCMIDRAVPDTERSLCDVCELLLLGNVRELKVLPDVLQAIT